MTESLLNYTEFSVVINAAEIYVDTAREWFLRSNSILQQEQVVQVLGDSTPFLAGVQTDQHVRILAQPHLLSVTQSGNGMQPKHNRSTEIMLRYLRAVPITSYLGLGINFTGILLTPKKKGVKRPLHRLLTYRGKWAELDGVSPTIGLNTSYTMSDRQINIKMEDVQNSENPDKKGIMFSCNVHRPAPNTTSDPPNETISVIVQKWRRDMNVFEQIVGSLKSSLVR